MREISNLMIRRILCKPLNLIVEVEVRLSNLFRGSSGDSGYKVIVDGDRGHSYSKWFHTRQSAREYKKLIRRDPGFKDVTIIHQIVTEEGFILDEKTIF